MTRVPVLFSMPKTNDATPKPRTHFEQVPIEVVKKIAEQDSPTQKKARTGRTGAPTSSKKG